MNIFRGMMGNEENGGSGTKDANTGVDAVEKLVERIQTATLYEDRRDALKTIRALSKEYRLEVGSMALPVIIACTQEKSSPDLISVALDTLCCVIGEADDIKDIQDGEHDELGERFAEILMKDTAQISRMLSLLDEYDFVIRRPGIHLMTGLARHCPRKMHEILLSDPAILPIIIDLMLETREVLRNDAILLLCEITRANADIQKLVAYENAFQTLLDIVAAEDVSSVVVEDCLFVVLNLLKNNASNQELFREQGYVHHIGRLLRHLLYPSTIGGESADDDALSSMGEWTTQRVANVVFTLQVVRCLVSPSNPLSSTSTAQKIMFDAKVFTDLCDILMATGVTVDVLSESLVTVAEVMRANERNQAHFATLATPDDLKKSAVNVLLLSMANERQPADLRAAVLYCFQSYVYKNSKAKKEIISTLLPSSADTSSSVSTAGHYLCSMIVSGEPIQVYFGAASLAHCLLGERKLKEELLRVQMAVSTGDAPTTLLRQVVHQLMDAGSRRSVTRVALLQLLCLWTYDCPMAIKTLLAEQEHVNYLTQTVGGVSGVSESDDTDDSIVSGLCAYLLSVAVHYNDDTKVCNSSSLRATIARRCGQDTFTNVMDSISRSSPYVKAIQRPQTLIDHKHPEQVMLDYEFAKLYKATEGELLRSVINEEKKAPITNGRSTDEGELRRTRAPTVEGYEVTPATDPALMGQADSVLQSYKELIKRQDAQMATLTQQLKQTQHDLQIAQQNNETINRQLQSERAKPASTVDTTALTAENAALKEQLTQYGTLVQTWQAESTRWQQFATQWQQFQVTTHGANGPQTDVIATLQQQLSTQEQQLTYGWQLYESQISQITEAQRAKDVSTKEKAALNAEIATLNATITSLRSTTPKTATLNTSALEKELNAVRGEQEDLLVLLADQDSKIRSYRRRLLAAGCDDAVSESDDDEEEEDTVLSNVPTTVIRNTKAPTSFAETAVNNGPPVYNMPAQQASVIAPTVPLAVVQPEHVQHVEHVGKLSPQGHAVQQVTSMPRQHAVEQPLTFEEPQGEAESQQRDEVSHQHTDQQFEHLPVQQQPPQQEPQHQAHHPEKQQVQSHYQQEPVQQYQPPVEHSMPPRAVEQPQQQPVPEHQQLPPLHTALDAMQMSEQPSPAMSQTASLPATTNLDDEIVEGGFAASTPFGHTPVVATSTSTVNSNVPDVVGSAFPDFGHLRHDHSHGVEAPAVENVNSSISPPPQQQPHLYHEEKSVEPVRQTPQPTPVPDTSDFDTIALDSQHTPDVTQEAEETMRYASAPPTSEGVLPYIHHETSLPPVASDTMQFYQPQSDTMPSVPAMPSMPPTVNNYFMPVEQPSAGQGVFDQLTQQQPFSQQSENQPQQYQQPPQDAQYQQYSTQPQMTQYQQPPYPDVTQYTQPQATHNQQAPQMYQQQQYQPSSEPQLFDFQQQHFNPQQQQPAAYFAQPPTQYAPPTTDGMTLHRDSSYAQQLHQEEESLR